jgi:hypothetical protein
MNDKVCPTLAVHNTHRDRLNWVESGYQGGAETKKSAPDPYETEGATQWASKYPLT